MEELENIHEREVEKRSNGSQVFTEPYSETAIERLKNLVTTFFGQGERKYYSILVDGEIVVPKNADGRKFSRYLQFVTEHTKTVEVRMFQGLSPNCNKYQFILNKGISLSGANQALNVPELIEKALEEQRLQSELKSLKENLAIKSEEVEELKEQIESSDTGVEQFTKLVQEGVQLAGVLGFAPKNGLAGTPETVQPDAEVEVEIQTESAQPNSDKEKNNQILNYLRKKYGEEGIQNALGWMLELNENPEIEEKLKTELKNKKNGEA